MAPVPVPPSFMQLLVAKCVALGGAFLAFASVCLGARCLYLAFFHPLARYPGPFLAKFTDLYAAYHAWKRDIHLDLHRCHQKYGDLVRYTPNRLAMNTAQALQDIHGRHAKVSKASTYKFLAQQAPNTFTLADKTLHATRRRLLSQAFSQSSLRLFEPKVHAKLDRLVSIIKGQKFNAGWSAPIDMTAAFDHLAFDMMTDVMFSQDFNTMGEKQYRYAIKAVEESNVRIGVLLQSGFRDTVGLDRKIFPKAAAASRRFVKFLRILLGRRLQADKVATDESSPDIFSFLERCRDPNTGKGLSLTEVSTETATFVVAGSDSTSNSLASTSHYLTGSSEWYRKVTAEIRSTFSSLEEIKLGPQLNSCNILRACMEESMRLSPPGGSALWRVVDAGGAMIDGHYIPQGCEVGVPIYTIHHNPRYWSEPFTFNPGRWLDTDKKTEMPYMPFSIGPRSCVGKPLATTQIMLTFARLLFEFDIRRAGSSPSWPDDGVETVPTAYTLKDHVVGWKEGPLLCFRPRN
ncbi:hypothetical protein BDW74DRAFT_185052 [Aspergillus multicolor]|uniref:cytochrome P450 n=1 Tax=Aspergillus multicolor TaxID=41759 RepID=UPI003CCD55C4